MRAGGSPDETRGPLARSAPEESRDRREGTKAMETEE